MGIQSEVLYMKRKYIARVLCLALVLMLGIMPLCTAHAAGNAYIVRVNSDYVRVRSADSSIMTSVPKGTRVLFWGERIGDMYKVMSATGHTGYIYKGYLSSYGVVNGSQVGVCVTRTPVYVRSGNSLRQAGTTAAGTLVLVYKVAGDWAFVKNINGNSAYIPLSYLKQVL